jgi:hypothetical protein
VQHALGRITARALALGTAIACTAILTINATAQAAVSAKQQLRLETGDLTVFAWAKQVTEDGYDEQIGDSPLDPAAQQWFVSAMQGEPYESGVGSSQGTGLENVAASKVRNLSFEWTGDEDFLFPHIRVEFTNGGVAYLSAQTCQTVIGYDDFGHLWSRADFTGSKAKGDKQCGIWMHSRTEVWDFYQATATSTAWQVLAAHHKTAVVSDVEWRAQGAEGSDEDLPPGYGDPSYIYSIQMDRLAMGALMWTGPNTVKKCTTEASC